VGRRERKRRKQGSAATAAATTTGATTTDHSDAEGNVLTLRDELGAGTLRRLERLESKPGASAEDRRQRRTELLFEHLAVRWEIAGLPLEGSKELLGRYRLASADERGRVREALAEHLRTRYPDLDV